MRQFIKIFVAVIAFVNIANAQEYAFPIGANKLCLKVAAGSCEKANTVNFGTGLSGSLSAGTLTITTTGGAPVTSVTATSPLASSGGATPDISIASTIAATLGGTGNASYAVGDVLYANTTTSLARRAAVAAGALFMSAGLNTASTYATTLSGNYTFTGNMGGNFFFSKGDTDSTHIIAPSASTGALVSGSAMLLNGGIGAAGSGITAGAEGGSLSLNGGAGGIGTASANPGNGAAVGVTGGNAGATGGLAGSGANGGDVNIAAGSASGTGTAGQVSIGSNLVTANNPNFGWNGSGTFQTSTGTTTINGNTTVVNGKTFAAETYKTTNLLMSALTPTISSGFGAGSSISANNGTAAFRVNTGDASASGVIGLPTATTGWNCYCTDITTQSSTVFLCKQIASTTTTATVANYDAAGASANWVGSDVLAVSCFAY